jgi:hypothetical protein
MERKNSTRYQLGCILISSVCLLGEISCSWYAILRRVAIVSRKQIQAAEGGTIEQHTTPEKQPDDYYTFTTPLQFYVWDRA